MTRTVTLIGGPGDGTRVSTAGVWRPTDPSEYPYEILGPVNYEAETIGFLWPLRLSPILDEELAPLLEFHDLDRRELHSLDPFTRYGMLVPEDGVTYRCRIFMPWQRRWRLQMQLRAVHEVMMYLAFPHGWGDDDHVMSMLEQLARHELREAVRLMVPAE